MKDKHVRFRSYVFFQCILNEDTECVRQDKKLDPVRKLLDPKVRQCLLSIYSYWGTIFGADHVVNITGNADFKGIPCNDLVLLFSFGTSLTILPLICLDRCFCIFDKSTF